MSHVRPEEIGKGNVIVERGVHGKVSRTSVLGITSDNIGCRGIHVQTAHGTVWCYDRDALIEIA